LRSNVSCRLQAQHMALTEPDGQIWIRCFMPGSMG
jgi:hypothetical protein